MGFDRRSRRGYLRHEEVNFMYWIIAITLALYVYRKRHPWGLNGPTEEEAGITYEQWQAEQAQREIEDARRMAAPPQTVTQRHLTSQQQ